MENFYVLYGTDKSLIQYEYQKIIKKLKIEEIIKYDMTNSNLEDVIEDASTTGLFSPKKIIVLEDAYFLTANKTIEKLEQLENYIEHYNPNNICIFLVYSEKIDTRKKINKLLNNHKIIELKKIDSTNIHQYIKDYLKDEYELEDIDYLIKKVGTNLYNLKNELDKLMMYKINEKKITNQDIDAIAIKTMEEEIFTLTDAIIANDKTKSLNLLEEFLNQNYDEMQIIMLLASQFRFLFQVKRLLNKNKKESEIAKILEANPYRIKYTVKKLYPYSEYTLLSYIQRLAKIDHDIKLGFMNKKLALELFIIHN